MLIGELARKVGVDPPTIRYYEAVGLLPEPRRTPSGYRLYDPQDEQRLRFVVAARSIGLGVEDIRAMLEVRDQGRPLCRHVRRALDEQLRRVEVQIEELKRLAGELRWMKERADSLPETASDDPCVCHILVSPGHPDGSVDRSSRPKAGADEHAVGPG